MRLGDPLTKYCDFSQKRWLGLKICLLAIALVVFGGLLVGLGGGAFAQILIVSGLVMSVFGAVLWLIAAVELRFDFKKEHQHARW